MSTIGRKSPVPALPGPLRPLGELAMNLWWSWDPEATALFEGLDPVAWERLRHNPVALLRELTAEQMAAMQDDPALVLRIAQIAARFADYMRRGDTWAAQERAELAAGREGVAYFSMEFGLHESLRTYSGGLGVLAGDHVRSASDLGLAFVGVGLLYRQGYFRQIIDDGQQVAAYPNLDFERLPLSQLLDAEGQPLTVEVPHGHHHYKAQLWELRVGRVRLILLDADHAANSWDHRYFTHQLYGGDTRTRAAQEVLLGIGGVRALRALGLRPAVYHLNEGHCAFVPVELLREQVEQGSTLAQAAEQVRQRVVFTTHTPVPAGHDRFSYYTVNEVLGGYRERMGWPEGTIMDMGRARPGDIHEPLCMTILAIKLSRAVNGVSALHGEVSRRMWKDLYPLVLDPEQVPIGHITNGVHPTFWLGPELRALFDRRAPAWMEQLCDAGFWADAIHRLPDEELWAAHLAARSRLADIIAWRGREARLDPSALTLGFARRFAPYKRANLLFTDPDRLERLMTGHHPLQLVIAGKAHPQDLHGQALLAEVLRWGRDPRFRHRVIFLQDYDMVLGRALTQGSDVWVNTPRRPREASGTSGQKAAINGVLNASVLDGWWPEGWDGQNGWAIGEVRDYHDHTEDQDAADARSLYEVLEREILPAWYDRSATGLPEAWVARMKRSIATCMPLFNTHRMVRDYAAVYGR